MSLTSRLPGPAIRFLKAARKMGITALYAGNGRYCPVCDKNYKKFASAGVVSRDDVECVGCGAWERHRLVWIFFNRQTDFLARPSAKVLHVAPEPSLEQLLRERFGDDYLTADFLDPRAMVQMDITNIQYPDNTFDVIYCSHVLEHVHDDRKAMREFARVLKPNSWAVLLVPIVADVTFEDPSITNPDEREKIFGQADHVRNYGLDYIDRLRESGFNVVRQRPSDFLDAEEIVKMGITPAAGDIYFCTHLTDANAR